MRVLSRDTLLLITTSYPQRGDGSEAAGAFVADMAEVLAEHIAVRVVAPGEQAGAEDQRGAVRIWRFASPGRPLSLLSPTRPADWLAIVKTLRSLRTQALAAAGDGRVAHTLALWALPSGWAAGVLQRRQGIPYSVWALGSDIWSLGRIPLANSVLRKVIRGASHRYADGMKLGEDAARISDRPFEFLPSTRRLSRQRVNTPSATPPYRLVFLGRWHLNKGIDLLLEALGSLDEGSWTKIVEVHIAGGGPLESLVREKVIALQALGRPIRLSAFLDREQATKALMEADYLLLPSRIESIPVVFSDAMKMRLPLISMPVGDMPGLLQRFGCGVIASAVSASAFSEALVDALSGSAARWSEGTAAAAHTFDLSTSVERLLQLVKGADV